MVKQTKTGDANFTGLHIPPKMFVDLFKQNVLCKSHKLQSTQIINWINTQHNQTSSMNGNWLKEGFKLIKEMI